jgi:AcrR family transcriptional regulator
MKGLEKPAAHRNNNDAKTHAVGPRSTDTRAGHRLPALFHVNVINMNVETDSSPRGYRMTARAVSTAATAERILDAALEMFWEMPTNQISLDEVARRSGVSVQTVIRRYGGKDGLVAAAAERESTAIRRQRDQAPTGDVTVAIQVLVEHYEAFGDRVLRMLAEQDRVPALRQIVDGGRTLHRDWCTRVFAAALAGREPDVRRRRLAQLVAVCDVYMWKLLRRDAGLSRRQTELAIVELLTPILKEP